MAARNSYMHYRKFENGVPSGKGGATVAITDDGKIARVGIARCSEQDNFCRATGRRIAAGRMIHAEGTNLDAHCIVLEIPSEDTKIKTLVDNYVSPYMAKFGLK